VSGGIPAFDPDAPRGPFYRTIDRFIRTRAGRAFGVTVAARIDPVLLRLTRGRLAAGMVLPTAVLRSTGARSGEPREAAVLYFSDGPDVVLIASNWGQARHPSWYHNLRAHPEASLERGGARGRYLAAEVVDDAERERLYAAAIRVYQGYADYRAETEAVGRRIPLMRLTPVA
jgi:deazaflavin-dependent oxidoreductase (nitroreductase family)